MFIIRKPDYDEDFNLEDTNYRREKHMHTSEIKSDLSISEQIIEAYYNENFIIEIEKWLFNQYKKNNQSLDFTSFDDIVLYYGCKEIKNCDCKYGTDGFVEHYIRYKKVRGDELTDRDWDYRVAVKYSDDQKAFREFISSTTADYKEIFGWIDHAIDIPKDHSYRYEFHESAIGIIFDVFIKYYPQYDTKFHIFTQIIDLINEFQERFFYRYYDEKFMTSFYLNNVNIKKHINLLEDMIAFFTPRQKKSARSAIDF